MLADIGTVRRAYELGRARVAVVRALTATTLVAVLGAVVVGRAALGWSACSFFALALAEWGGGALSRGAHRGLVAGLVTLMLPMSVLRPCCDASMIASGSCCTMPSLCGVSGIVIGLAVALVWPRERSSRDHALAGAGVGLGALSIAAMRCEGLFLGEALGLAGGLVAGVAASTAARAWMTSRSVR
jgi:hypothetical protein